MEFYQPYNPFKLFTGIFIPQALVRSKDLSLGAKVIFGRLARYAGEKGECYPRVDTLADEVGISERQAQRYLAELEEVRLISRKQRGSTSSLYQFLWNPVFVTPEVTDVSPPEVTDVSPKESQVKESQLNINNRDDGASGEPPRLITEEEWPRTTALVQGRFFSVDSIFMSRLIHLSLQAAISAVGSAEEVTDARLAWMVEEVLKNPKVYSAGLLLTAIPQGIKNLYKSQLVSGGRK